MLVVVVPFYDSKTERKTTTSRIINNTQLTHVFLTPGHKNHRKKANNIKVSGAGLEHLLPPTPKNKVFAK